MKCIYCSHEIADDSRFCSFCGKPVEKQEKSKKKRGNGQGSVFKLDNGTYIAVVTTGYFLDDDGKLHRKTRSKVFKKKSDAIAALPGLKTETIKAEKRAVAFKGLYDQWLPTHRAGKSTIDCYKAAVKYFSPLFATPITEIDVDDLQECIDDCPHGKRTKENMRAVCGLMYKYGIPRHMIPENLNLATFLHVDGDSAAHRESFTDVQIEKIKKACGVVPQAEIIYIMIHLGFRPSEFLSLRREDYHPDELGGYFIAGAKTDAGKGRLVTVSPKILPYLKQIMPESGYIVSNNGKQYSLQSFSESIFYPALEAIGIDNPMVEIAGGKLRHRYTPHTCRHTFATLMKRVAGTDKDKQELIGHASAEMLRYYQDVNVSDLHRITHAI